MAKKHHGGGHTPHQKRLHTSPIDHGNAHVPMVDGKDHLAHESHHHQNKKHMIHGFAVPEGDGQDGDDFDSHLGCNEEHE